ncbi:MAG: hypothetical protein HQK72_12365 [Desulfamplus sp.]|nr:hypothetical protein [Desulfamplus sp.]
MDFAYQILKDAIIAVPAIKYALGIAGIISVIAIIKSFKIDWRIAFFGTVIMLFLMVVLVIFARLTQQQDMSFRLPILVFIWFSLLLMMAVAIMLFTSVFFAKPLDLRAILNPNQKDNSDSKKNDKEKVNKSNLLTLKPNITNIHVQWKHNIHEINGINSHNCVFENDNIPQKVFSIELLEEPLILRKEKDKLTVNINRKNIEYAVYNNQGKRELCKKCFNKQEHIVNFAKDVDTKVHEYFLGKSDFNEIEIILKDLPLRWSSGGVFCVVDYDNREWTPFFFRDIEPCGWNIPLGGSENLQEVNNPWNALWREFMEEFLVLAETPKSDSKIKVRKPVFPKVNELTLSYKSALNLMNKHIDLRRNFDNLDLIISDDDLIDYDVVETNTILNISSDFSSSQSKNILVAINPFELGIEAVAIIKCKFDKNDYLLDGEIMEPKGGIRELVRMPVALISHDYLKKAFDKDSFKLEYQGLSQASVKRDDIPKDDIIIFGWDISNRLSIVENKKTGMRTEFERYRKWKDDFGLFFMNNNLNQFNQALGLFTPTSAKISSYFFAQKQA